MTTTTKTSRTFTQAEVIRLALGADRNNLHTAMPGEVVAYDMEAGTVDVQPLIHRVVQDFDGNKLIEKLPQIPSVPIMWPRGGGAFMTFPIAPGDTVMIMCCDRSIDQWFAKGKATEPVDLRLHALGNAVAIPGLYPSTVPLADVHAANVVIGFDGAAGGGQIHIKPDGTIHLGEENATDFLALAAQVTAQLDALKSAINSWTPVPADGGAALKTILTTLFSTWPGNVAATKVKGT